MQSPLGWGTFPLLPTHCSHGPYTLLFPTFSYHNLLSTKRKKEWKIVVFYYYYFSWKSTSLSYCLLLSFLSRHTVTLVGFVLSFWVHWGLSPSCLWFVLFQEQEADQLNALKSKPLRRSEIKPNSPGNNWRWLTIQYFYSNYKGFFG